MNEALEMLSPGLVRNVLLGSAFLFLLYLLFRKVQDTNLNWAMFYSFLWVSISLFLVNGLSVYWGFWSFKEERSTLIPHDLFFDWVVFWGVFVPFVMKGRYLIITALFLFWIDILFMPLLAKLGLLDLRENWLIGEFLLIFLVFIPSQLWFRFSWKAINLGWRSFFQVLVMAFVLLIGLPFLANLYQSESMPLVPRVTSIWMQIIFIIALPSLIAVVDLVEKGQGTPFPFDPTKKLVRSGVYAYIRNPIQWSFTWLFAPLAAMYQSELMLLGVLVSVAYVIGVSNPDEKVSMAHRFGDEWKRYKRMVPAWYFKWRPTSITPAKIYFNKDCSICSFLRSWMENRNPLYLEFMDANQHDIVLENLRYENEEGTKYSSVKALASCLEHINLAWASLAWLMRLPIISHVLQIIVDTMGIGADTCKVSE